MPSRSLLARHRVNRRLGQIWGTIKSNFDCNVGSIDELASTATLAVVSLEELPPQAAIRCVSLMGIGKSQRYLIAAFDESKTKAIAILGRHVDEAQLLAVENATLDSPAVEHLAPDRHRASFSIAETVVRIEAVGLSEASFSQTLRSLTVLPRRKQTD